jgi:Skp family chaperone for outer membrane proteins
LRPKTGKRTITNVELTFLADTIMPAFRSLVLALAVACATAFAPMPRMPLRAAPLAMDKEALEAEGAKLTSDAISRIEKKRDELIAQVEAESAAVDMDLEAAKAKLEELSTAGAERAAAFSESVFDEK